MVNLEVSIQSKMYSGHQQVLGANQFSVNAGEFVAIVGPSGTGKSTLLNMLSGLEPCSEGEVLLNQKPLSSHSSCDIGYIFQQPRLMPWLTVQENLRLVTPLASITAVDEQLNKVGLPGKGKLYPKQLSGGMQRRVSIARAFLTPPELLLLDEPFVSLDAPNANRLRGLLLSLWQEHKPTVVFVTHDLSEAIQLADRIIFLSSAPGAVILDKSVDLPRPRVETDKIFQYWKEQLLTQHPNLLEGEMCEPVLKSMTGGLA